MDEQQAQRLALLADEYRQAKEALDKARGALVAEIRAAATAAGMKQADIIRATDHVWTREQVRKIVG
jgi:hypothetical protein